MQTITTPDPNLLETVVRSDSIDVRTYFPWIYKDILEPKHMTTLVVILHAEMRDARQDVRGKLEKYPPALGIWWESLREIAHNPLQSFSCTLCTCGIKYWSAEARVRRANVPQRERWPQTHASDQPSGL